MEVEFTVPGPPQGKARARTFYNGTRMQSITPDKTVLYENLIKIMYTNTVKTKWLNNEPLAVEIICYYPVPQSKSKKVKKQMCENALRPTKKPDADNVAKCILDALNKLAYKDDTQVVELNVKKYYVEEHKEPRVVVRIKDL